MDKRTKLINQIVNGEYLMFCRIPGAYPITSQESEKGFRLARASVFASWSEATLESYAQDIAEGMRAGRNFMTEKYARMDDLMPPINTNPLVEKIADMEANWQQEVRAKYPLLLKEKQEAPSDGSSENPSFLKYLQSELETYSDRTLESYWQDISVACDEERNLAEEKYLKMVQRLGHDSIEDYERSLAAEQPE